jgi:tRNA-uridine 2-sulfurtransferase
MSPALPKRFRVTKERKSGVRAIALVSGGLDSTLAAKLTQGLGIELVALNTVSPFCLCNHHSAKGCLHGASMVAKDLGIKLVSINVAEEFIQIVKNPPHGYGSQMNPCIDCRILLFKKARELMPDVGASFIITGEVLAQRPMSQRRDTMQLIEKEAGLKDLVVRPLSARVLEPTIPERQGWVLRDKLLAISGRGRKEQFALAGQLGVGDFPCPSGGCLLTDPEFSKRLKDLMRYKSDFTLNDILLLKVGRHFRLKDNSKLVVGRNEKENQAIIRLALSGDYILKPPDEIAGPTALGRGEFNQELISLSSSIVCHYCDLNGSTSADIVYYKLQDKEDRLKGIIPQEQTMLTALRI